MSKVLIVEDEPDFIHMLEIILKRKGFEVVHAERGQDGLVLAEVEAPDVIILDMMLPDLDGVQFCRQLRATSAIAHIPILVLSARMDPSEQKKALAAGANVYLIKPAGSAELVEHLQRLLNRENPS